MDCKPVARENSRIKGRVIAHLSQNNLHKSFFVHCLVLRTFIGPCPEGMEGCHNNGNPSDNRLSNLRWDSHKNNQQDMVTHGKASFRGASNPRTQLTPEDIRNIRQAVANGESFTAVAKKFHITYRGVRSIIKRITWAHLSD